MTGAVIRHDNAPTMRARSYQAVQMIERAATRLTYDTRRTSAERQRDLDIIERQLKVLVIAVEAAYRSSGP